MFKFIPTGPLQPNKDSAGERQCYVKEKKNAQQTTVQPD